MNCDEHQLTPLAGYSLVQVSPQAPRECMWPTVLFSLLPVLLPSRSRRLRSWHRFSTFPTCPPFTSVLVQWQCESPPPGKAMATHLLALASMLFRAKRSSRGWSGTSVRGSMLREKNKRELAQLKADNLPDSGKRTAASGPSTVHAPEAHGRKRQ